MTRSVCMVWRLRGRHCWAQTTAAVQSAVQQHAMIETGAWGSSSWGCHDSKQLHEAAHLHFRFSHGGLVCLSSRRRCRGLATVRHIAEAGGQPVGPACDWVQGRAGRAHSAQAPGMSQLHGPLLEPARIEQLQVVEGGNFQCFLMALRSAGHDVMLCAQKG